MTAPRTLTDALVDLIDSRTSQIRVALPARVETYDATTQKVSCQVLVKDGYYDLGNVRQLERLPVITDVPVMFPGAGGYRVTFPIAVGDTVLLVFASSSLDRWLGLGGEVDPQDDRRHHLSDAIAIPGLRDFAHALGNAPTSTMSLGKDGGPTIEISASTIQAGGASALALASDLSSLKTAINGWTPVAGDGGAALKTALTTLFASWPNPTTTLKGG